MCVCVCGGGGGGGGWVGGKGEEEAIVEVAICLPRYQGVQEFSEVSIV